MFFFQLQDEAKYFKLNGLLYEDEFYFPSIDFSKLTTYCKFHKHVESKIPSLRKLLNFYPKSCIVKENSAMMSVRQVNEVLMKLIRNHPDDKKLTTVAAWFWSILDDGEFGNLRLVSGDMDKILRRPIYSASITPVFEQSLKGEWHVLRFRECFGKKYLGANESNPSMQVSTESQPMVLPVLENKCDNEPVSFENVSPTRQLDMDIMETFQTDYDSTLTVL